MEIKAVGIDLGTTYSTISIVRSDGQPGIIPNTESERLTPSAVLFEPDSIVVGQIAKDAASSDPDNTVQFIKREIGSPHWFYTYKGQRHTPTDVSALILKKLKNDAEIYLGYPIIYAVITVPAYFDDDRRRETRKAAEIAGFKVLELINEPTSAAIAFGVERARSEETVLVYDLGGGTFDVTVMTVQNKKIKIIGSDGDPRLGGKDFDDALMRFLVKEFKAKHGFDPTDDIFMAGEMRVIAEKAKRELSQRTKTMVTVRAKGYVNRTPLTRTQFSELIRPKIENSLSVVRSVLREIQMSPDQIDRILLIGGSTRVPLIRETLAKYFGKDPDFAINPDEAVSFGAALMAAKLFINIEPDAVPSDVEEKVGGLSITDVTTHSLGIEAFVPGTQDTFNSILIKRNSPIPNEVSKEFATTLKGQTAISVKILQGESMDLNESKLIGDFVLRGLPPNRPPGQKVRINIKCNASGIVEVSAIDIATGIRAQTEVSYKIGTSSQQVSAKQRWLEMQDIQ